MAIKVGIGKWPEAVSLIDNFENELATADIRLLSIAVPHVRMAGLFQSAHKDQFDRLLAAQALTEGLTLVTADAKLRALGAPGFGDLALRLQGVAASQHPFETRSFPGWPAPTPPIHQMPRPFAIVDRRFVVDASVRVRHERAFNQGSMTQLPPRPVWRMADVPQG